MKISLIHPTMYYLGGAERVVYTLAEALTKRGHSIEIVSLKFNDFWRKKAKNLEITLKEVGYAPSRLSYFLNIGFLSRKLSVLISKNVEVLCPHNFPATLAVMEYKKACKAKIPAVWYCHEPFRFYYDQEYFKNVPLHFCLIFAMSKQLYCKYDKIAVKNFVDLILTNSKFNLERVREIYGINGSVVYMATDPNKFKPNIVVPKKIRTFKEGVDWFLFAPVGRLNFSKNVIRLVLAAKELLNRGYKFRLLITGKGYLESKLRELINKLSIPSYVMLETVSEDELPYYYATADIVVYPAINEPFGLSVIEAMASSTPPVVANIGGPSETVINGVTGIHVNPYEVFSIVNGITVLLDDKNLREEMGRQGRKHVLANFTWKRAVNEYEYYLMKITGGGGRNV